MISVKNESVMFIIVVRLFNINKNTYIDIYSNDQKE